jgi:protein-tyrosine phosphatase
VGVPDLWARAEAAGFEVFRLAVPDQGTPTLAEARALVRHIQGRLQAGGRVVVHCLGGLGRSGLIAGCLLRAQGRDAAAAIAHVRAARGPRAIETPAQERFVAAYASG